MHRVHLRGTIGQDNEAQVSVITREKPVKKPVKILIIWSGAVVPAYRQFFLELARHYAGARPLPAAMDARFEGLFRSGSRFRQVRDR